ncbi:TPA: DNA circularization protein [Escherichia coli]|nr:DNA circularization protein [Escherichia coli]HDH7160033.1 DNA circularization protein [Escherichia coli]
MAIIQDAISSLMGGGGSENWQDQLSPSSFRGVPFAVLVEESGHGRRQAVHEYPYRDTAWIEDMGRSVRRITVRGFIVQNSQVYGGGDAISQRQALIAACEEKGPGTLIHPTLGEMTVSVPDGGLRISGTAEAGRVFEFTLTAIESGLKVFAVTGNSVAGATVGTNYLQLVTTTVASVLARIKSEIRGVTQAVNTIKGTISFWTNMVDSTISEVTNVSNVLKSTFGNSRYGRYSKGSVGGSSSATTGTTKADDTDNYQTLATQVTAQSIVDRQKIADAITLLNDASEPEVFTQRVADVVNLILNSAGGASERVKALETLANSTSTEYQQSDATRQIAASINTLIIVLCSGAMAAAAVESNPTSRDEAESVTQRVADQLDSALLVVGDRADDELYSALLTVRSSFIDTMATVSLNLSELMQVSTGRTLPALTLANRLYQDASRADELVQEANVPHPAFMPANMKVLRQ